MKRLLTALGAIGLVASASISTVSCHIGQDTDSNLTDDIIDKDLGTLKSATAESIFKAVNAKNYVPDDIDEENVINITDIGATIASNGTDHKGSVDVSFKVDPNAITTKYDLPELKEGTGTQYINDWILFTSYQELWQSAWHAATEGDRDGVVDSLEYAYRNMFYPLLSVTNDGWKLLDVSEISSSEFNHLDALQNWFDLDYPAILAESFADEIITWYTDEPNMTYNTFLGKVKDAHKEFGESEYEWTITLDDKATENNINVQTDNGWYFGYSILDFFNEGTITGYKTQLIISD